MAEECKLQSDQQRGVVRDSVRPDFAQTVTVLWALKRRVPQSHKIVFGTPKS